MDNPMIIYDINTFERQDIPVINSMLKKNIKKQGKVS